MEIVRDKLWLWGHDAGSHDEGWGLDGISRITPVEAAFYLGIPNMAMVRYGEESLRASVQYSVPFRPLKEVVWSIVGAGGMTAGEERNQVIELAQDLPNMTGVIMDDFFRKEGDEDHIGTLFLGELWNTREKLQGAARPLDLWVVLYDHQLERPVKRYLGLCDKVTFWTWKAEDLDKLEENLRVVEDLAPTAGKLLGCYMWDYGAKRPMPLELMKKQCERGLEWLQEGRIEGMIFLASCICDIGLETVAWTRDWIMSVGERNLRPAKDEVQI